MAFPTLTPTSTQSAIILPPTGTAGDVLSSLPFGIYTTGSFISGAVDQVAYTYRKLGGDILDLEKNVTGPGGPPASAGSPACPDVRSSSPVSARNMFSFLKVVSPCLQ